MSMEPATTVKLADRSYPITIGANLSGPLRAHLEKVSQQARPLAVVMDAALAAAQPEFSREVFADYPAHLLPSGESSKSMQELERLYDFFASIPLDRSGLVIAFGGGVVGDCAGFAAASFLRGIELCMVPTTLLSMVDSSVGGKTGINLRAGKNLVGAFHQPSSVWIDTQLLKTLPPREFSAGMAEVIKYGMLGNFELFQALEAESALHPDHPFLPQAITRCCAQKAAIVQADEREIASCGGRALLNLGHTFAHAIEATAGYGTYLHGEAVAIGLLLASRLSMTAENFPSSSVDRVEALLQRYQLPTALKDPLPLESLIAAMKRDKKVRQGQLRLVLMEALGRAITTDNVSENQIQNTWATAGARP